MACSRVYLFAFEIAEALRAEFFDREAAEDRAVHHSAAECRVIRTAAAGKIAHETASKGVACSGGVVRLLQGERRDAEDAALIHHHGAVLAAFDDEGCWTELEDVAGCEEKVVFVRELAGFGIVDHQDIDLL